MSLAAFFIWTSLAVSQGLIVNKPSQNAFTGFYSNLIFPGVMPYESLFLLAYALVQK